MTGVDGLGPSRWSVDVGDTVADIAWSPTDGRIGIGCSGGEVVVVNETGDTVDRRLPHRSGTSCVTWFDGEVASGGVDGWVDIGGQRERAGGWVSALTVGAAGIGGAHGRHVSVLGGATSDPLPASVAQVRWASGSSLDARSVYGQLSLGSLEALARRCNAARLHGLWHGPMHDF
jgi:hypothetical protein